MKFKVALKKKLISLDGKKSSWGNVEFILPFAPFVGLTLTLSFCKSRLYNTAEPPIQSIHYNMEEEQFYCIIEEHGHINTIAGEILLCDLDYLIEASKKKGWKGFDLMYDEETEGTLKYDEQTGKYIKIEF